MSPLKRGWAVSRMRMRLGEKEKGVMQVWFGWMTADVGWS